MADCKAKGWPVSVAVVGRNGELLVHSAATAPGRTPWITATEGFTARTIRQPSGEMAKRLKADPQLGAGTLPNVVAAARARCRSRSATTSVGAAGASGAPGGEKDEACVQTGLDKVKDQLK